MGAERFWRWNFTRVASLCLARTKNSGHSNCHGHILSLIIDFFFFLKKRTHSSDGWMQKKSRQNERKSLLSLRVFSPQKKSLNLSHHHHHHLLSIHTSLYRTERRLNHFSGGREDASKKRSAVSESVTHRDGEF